MTTTAAPPSVSVRLLRVAPRWWSDLAGVAAGLTLLIVTALWVHDGGLRQPAATAAGRITGLWSADLLLLQVLLMARVPVAERAFGQDRLARWHRWVGFTSFWLMVAHIVLITLGYAGAAGANPFAELWDMIVDYPGMLLATAGTALLVLVVATSIRAARRRLRYESWHLLHLYAYLGVGLALPHQLWTGADFLGSPAATAYWWTIYAAAAGAVVTYRIGLPAWRNARHRLVVSARPPTPGCPPGARTPSCSPGDPGRKRMRRITLWLFSTVAALVLLFSYRTSTGGTGAARTVATDPTATSADGARIYTGSVEQTRWGPVQVTITVADGKITDVAVPVHPNENGRDQEINARALPILRQETLEAQSADIDAVSGATVTTDGYLASLQSALDAAHLT